jgi:hypothetical protein
MESNKTALKRGIARTQVLRKKKSKWRALIGSGQYGKTQTNLKPRAKTIQPANARATTTMENGVLININRLVKASVSRKITFTRK